MLFGVSGAMFFVLGGLEGGGTLSGALSLAAGVSFWAAAFLHLRVWRQLRAKRDVTGL